MITTDFKLGTPCWLELNTPDVEATAEFYRRVFGWTLHGIGFDAGGYKFMSKGDRAAAAIGPLEHEEQRPGWTVIFASDDVERTIDEAEGLGGSIYVEPFAVPPMGRMTLLLDSQGGVFGLWQGQDFAGFEVANEPDSFGWAELWTPDTESSKSFYTGIFGWEYEAVEGNGQGGYTAVRRTGDGVDGMRGGIRQVDRARLPGSEGAPVWHPVFMVADCDASVALVRDSGGKLYVGPQETARAGRAALCADPVGAEFALLSPVPVG